MNNNLSTRERWLALVVRYWSANMDKIHERKMEWPGFGYDEEEKKEMASQAERLQRGEFMTFAVVLSVIAICFFAVVVYAGMSCLLWAIGGEQNMATTPAPLFFLSLALQCIVALSVGLPAAMLPSAAIVAKWYKVPDADLPDRATTDRYFRKLCFQITRMTLIMTAAVLPLWLFVPADSKFMAMVRVIVPLLSPVVSVLTMIYYFSTPRPATTLDSSRS